MSTVAVFAILSGSVATALFVAMQRRMGSLRPSIVALQLAFTEARFRSVLAAWGTDGVLRFRSHFPLDYEFLTAYAIFGATAGTWFVDNADTERTLGAVLPWLCPAAACFDALENLLHQHLVAARPGSQPRAMFAAAALSASIKWLLLAGVVPIAALAWFIGAA